MRNMRVLQRTVIALFLFSAGQSTLTASEPISEDVRCPIGGEIFEYVHVGNSNIDRRPDGKTYGFPNAPLNLPECPENGLVLFDDFTPSEIAKLEPLIQSAAYKSLRKSDTQYYRAYWLAAQLGRDKILIDNLLAQAIWEADDNPSQRLRYLRLYADTAQKPQNDASENALWSTLRLANAHRELGDFATAKAVLAAIILPPEPNAEPKDEWVHEQWKQSITYVQKFATVIERGDTSSEPLDMLPQRIAAEKCWDMRNGYSDFAKAFCGQPNIVKEMEWFSPEAQAERVAAADAAMDAAENAVNGARASIAADNAMAAAANAIAATDTTIPQ
ncbi:MAG: hypothetical protein WA085_10495 [Sphingobium sp.]